MKPYVIVSGGFLKTGAMDKANHAVALYLANRGDEVHLVAYCIDEDLRRHPNVVCHIVPKLARSNMLSEPLLNRIGRHWAARIADRGGRTIVNGGNCEWDDVNWVHYLHAAWRPKMAAGPLWKIKSAVGYLRSVREERKIVARARLAIANSEYTKRDLQEKLGLDARRIRTVYCGSDPKLFRPASPTERVKLRQELELSASPCVAFVGALGDRRKGFDILFEAWATLCGYAERWDAQLVVAGAGAELAAWKKRAAKRGLASRMRFLGFRNDIAQILRASDLLVSPTRYEAYGLNVHEALCCGVPALVSADAGVAERYPESLRDFLIARPLKVDFLVEKLNAWRSALDSWRELALCISKKLREYTWNDMAREIVALIDESEVNLSHRESRLL
jgi:glycosyltransferase involved in cell wall biosynthesis